MNGFIGLLFLEAMWDITVGTLWIAAVVLVVILIARWREKK